MPSYKLVYVNTRGYAEPTRMMLAHVGQEFEDVRYSREEWLEHKPNVPLQQLPYLQVGDVTITQSRAIEGFVARQFGLDGTNNEETTKIEAIVSMLADDLRKPIGTIMYDEKDEEEKVNAAKFYAQTAPKYLSWLEKTLAENQEGGGGFFVGSKISRADIFFHTVCEFLDGDELKKYPTLVNLRERIASDANIAAWLARRPQTQW